MGAKRKTRKGTAVVSTVPAFRTRDLEQITSEMIAWAESGWSKDPMALPAVYASVRLIASTINQLPVEVENGDVPGWLLKPRQWGGALDLGDVIQHTVVSMALQGKAFWRCSRVGDSWRIDALHNSSVQTQVSTSGIVQIKFLVDGIEMPQVPVVRTQWDNGPFLLHVPYLITPDHPEGLSPIQAARQAIDGYQQVEKQAATLLDNGTYSGGRLESDQDITQATAERYQQTWVANRKIGNLPVLGAGLKYVNDLIDPASAQWLESRQFNTQQILQMYGIPPDYLGLTLMGGSSSLSYSNAQDNDKRFRRNCLAAFTQQISDAVSVLLPPGRGESENQKLIFDYSRWEGEGIAPADSNGIPDQGE